MAKIKIKDLPKNQKISKAELKKVRGGYYARISLDPGQDGNIPISYTADVTQIRTQFLSPISQYADTW